MIARIFRQTMLLNQTFDTISKLRFSIYQDLHFQNSSLKETGDVENAKKLLTCFCVCDILLLSTGWDIYTLATLPLIPTTFCN